MAAPGPILAGLTIYYRSGRIRGSSNKVARQRPSLQSNDVIASCYQATKRNQIWRKPQYNTIVYFAKTSKNSTKIYQMMSLLSSTRSNATPDGQVLPWRPSPPLVAQTTHGGPVLPWRPSPLLEAQFSPGSPVHPWRGSVRCIVRNKAESCCRHAVMPAIIITSRLIADVQSSCSGNPFVMADYIYSMPHSQWHSFSRSPLP